MDALGTTVPPSLAAPSLRPPRKPPEDRGIRLAWALFLVLGLPFFAMAALTVLAAARIYVEPLRALWQTWPPEVLKPFLGVAAFAATLAYLAYRVGRSGGFRSGHVAGLAAGRNLAEGWMPLAAPDVISPTAPTPDGTSAPPSPPVSPSAAPTTVTSVPDRPTSNGKTSGN